MPTDPLLGQSDSERAEREFLEGQRYEDKFPDDDAVCAGYPEHDYVLVDDRDGNTYRCRRCDAETWDEE